MHVVVSAGQGAEYFASGNNLFAGYVVFDHAGGRVHDPRCADGIFAGLYCAIDRRSLRHSPNMADNSLPAEPEDVKWVF